MQPLSSYNNDERIGWWHHHQRMHLSPLICCLSKCHLVKHMKDWGWRETKCMPYCQRLRSSTSMYTKNSTFITTFNNNLHQVMDCVFFKACHITATAVIYWAHIMCLLLCWVLYILFSLRGGVKEMLKATQGMSDRVKTKPTLWTPKTHYDNGDS
jgi:hypothetical protein